jgi:putative transposase
MTLSSNNVVLPVQTKAHRIRLHPTPEQVGYLKRACGTRRFIYNWGLAEWQRQYAAYKEERASLPEGHHTLKPPHALALKKQFNAIRAEQFPWTYNVTKCVVEGAFDDFGKSLYQLLRRQNPLSQIQEEGQVPRVVLPEQ